MSNRRTRTLWLCRIGMAVCLLMGAGTIPLAMWMGVTGMRTMFMLLLWIGVAAACRKKLITLRLAPARFGSFTGY